MSGLTRKLKKKLKKKIHESKWKWKQNSPKSLGWSKNGLKRKVQNTGLPPETKLSNTQPNLIPEGARKVTGKKA